MLAPSGAETPSSTGTPSGSSAGGNASPGAGGAPNKHLLVGVVVALVAFFGLCFVATVIVLRRPRRERGAAPPAVDPGTDLIVEVNHNVQVIMEALAAAEAQGALPHPSAHENAQRFADR